MGACVTPSPSSALSLADAPPTPPFKKPPKPTEEEKKVTLSNRKISIFEKGKKTLPGEEEETSPSETRVLIERDNARKGARSASSVFGNLRNYFSKSIFFVL